MDAREIRATGLKLLRYLAAFDDCVGRSEPREHLRTYVRRQLFDLPRKSVELIGLSANVPPRTLQRFMESVEWDEVRLRDKLQHVVAADQADGQAIGIIDKTGQRLMLRGNAPGSSFRRRQGQDWPDRAVSWARNTAREAVVAGIGQVARVQ